VTERFTIEKLASSHDRASFSSGVDALDRYLRQFAGQDTRKRLANCFVALEKASGQLAGFYTLSASSISVSDLPELIAKRLPHYPNVPAALIGRLAVDMRFRRQRLGEALLLDAVDRVLDSDPAVFALVVDAKDEAAVSFYMRYEFRRLSAKQMSLFLPVPALEARRRQDSRP
jgi:ribosomal protein S18 acetylase RimI-like enzyme